LIIILRGGLEWFALMKLWRLAVERVLELLIVEALVAEYNLTAYYLETP
jgi:hypothetical protein